MQKITLLCPSSVLKDPPIQSLTQDYIKRITGKVDIVELNVKGNNHDTPDQVKSSQGRMILSYLDKLSQNTLMIALDEKGKMLSSRDLASDILKYQIDGYSSLCFIIGGAYGLCHNVLSRVHTSLSLGKMVWPHRLVAVMILEQIYRAQQINAGHPYHKD